MVGIIFIVQKPIKYINHCIVFKIKLTGKVIMKKSMPISDNQMLLIISSRRSLKIHHFFVVCLLLYSSYNSLLSYSLWWENNYLYAQRRVGLGSSLVLLTPSEVIEKQPWLIPVPIIGIGNIFLGKSFNTLE